MKKFFSLVLALVMALSLTTVAWGADVAAYGGTNYGSLQDAIDAAEATGGTITLLADCGEDVVVEQAPNVAIVIDGANKTYTGTITVDGKSAAYPTAALKIQNVNFDATSITKAAYINMGGNNAMRYISNLTVTGCTFSYSGSGDVVAVKSYTGGDKNLTIEGCIVNSGMHSLLQVKNVETGVKIIGCKVYSKEGVNLNSTPALEMSGCEFDVQGYAVRVGVNGTVNTTEKSFTITDSTLKSACADGDAVIVFRDDAKKAEVTITDTTLTGTTTFAGNDDVTDITVDGVPTDAVAQVGSDYYKTVADAIAAANGAPVVLLDPSATIPAGYTALANGTVVKTPAAAATDPVLYVADNSAAGWSAYYIATGKTLDKLAQDSSDNCLPCYLIDGDYFVEVKEAAATYKLVHGNKTVFLKDVPSSVVCYVDTASVLTVVDADDAKCGDFYVTDLDEDDVYYISYNKKGDAIDGIWVAAKTGTVQILVKGKIVNAEDATSDVDFMDHDWKGYEVANYEYTSVKCSECGKVAKLYANATAAGKKAVPVAGGWITYADATDYGAVSTPSTDKVQSADTFDAGIAMYVGMSVMAAAGSAVVLKKRED